VESAHHKRSVSARNMHHVFQPSCGMHHDNPVCTYAWEPLSENAEMSAFIRWCVRRDDAPTMWFQSIKDRDRISRELEQTVGDSDLPVLDLTCKKFGLANSFRYVAAYGVMPPPFSPFSSAELDQFSLPHRNGVYFVFSGKFVPHSQIDSGRYKDLTTQYIDAWYHVERHEAALLGPPDPSKVDFDPRARFKNLHKNEVCVACGGTRLYHNPTQCRMRNKPRFKLRCVVCKKTQKPSMRRRMRKRARLDRRRRAGLSSDDDDDDDPTSSEEDEEDEDEEEDVMFEEGDGEGAGRAEDKHCSCKDADGQPFFQCYDIDLRKCLRSIDTPYIDGIVDQQWKHFDDYDEVYYWFFVLLGRWLFPLSAQWDDWQKLLCIFGSAGTGTLLRFGFVSTTVWLRVYYGLASCLLRFGFVSGFVSAPVWSLLGTAPSA